MCMLGWLLSADKFDDRGLSLTVARARRFEWVGRFGISAKYYERAIKISDKRNDMFTWVEALIGRLRVLTASQLHSEKHGLDVEKLTREAYDFAYTLESKEAENLRETYERFLESKGKKTSTWEEISSTAKRIAAERKNTRLQLAPYLSPRRLNVILTSIREFKEAGETGRSGSLLFYVVPMGNRMEGRAMIRNYGNGIVDLDALRTNFQNHHSDFERVEENTNHWFRGRYKGASFTCFQDGIAICSAINNPHGETELRTMLRVEGKMIGSYIKPIRNKPAR